MSQIDVRVFALITTATVFVVGVLKKLFPKLVDDKEEIWAVALPVIFVVIAKATKQFHGTDWVDALLWALGSGVLSGASHDYGVKPFLALFVKAPSTSGEPTPPDSGSTGSGPKV